MKRRVISILLAMIMVLGYLLPANGFTALAAEGTSSVGLEPAPSLRRSLSTMQVPTIWTPSSPAVYPSSMVRARAAGLSRAISL